MSIAKTTPFGCGNDRKKVFVNSVTRTFRYLSKTPTNIFKNNIFGKMEKSYEVFSLPDQ